MEGKQIPDQEAWQAKEDRDVLVIFEDESHTCKAFRKLCQESLNRATAPVQTLWITRTRQETHCRVRDGTIQQGFVDKLPSFFSLTLEWPLSRVPEMILISRQLLQKGKAGIEDISCLLAKHLRDPQPGVHTMARWVVGRVINWMQTIESFPIHCGENLSSALFLTLSAAHEAKWDKPRSSTGARIWWFSPNASEVTPRIEWLDVDIDLVSQRHSDVTWSDDPNFVAGKSVVIPNFVACAPWVRLCDGRLDQVQTQLISTLQSSLLPDLIRIVLTHLYRIPVPFPKATNHHRIQHL